MAIDAISTGESVSVQVTRAFDPMLAVVIFLLIGAIIYLVLKRRKKNEKSNYSRHFDAVFDGNDSSNSK